MAIVYRGVKGSRLTVAEIDGNFEHLSDEVNTKVDSNEVRTIVDSAYIQTRQLTFDFMDSSEVIALIDSSYVNARVNSANSLDSAEALDLMQDKLQNLSYSIIPDSNEAYDLGSSSRRFRDLYLSGNTLVLGGISLKKDSDNAFTIGTDLVGGEAIAAGWWDTQWFKTGPKTGGAELKVRIDDVPSDFENQEWIKFLRNIQPGDTITIETPVRQVINVTSTVTEDHFSATQFRFYFGVDTAPDIAGTDVYVYKVSKTLTPTNNIRIKYSASDVADWGGTSPLNVSAALDKLAKNSTDYMDSAEVTTLVDSAYVQARQNYAYSSLTGVPTTVTSFTNDANYLDSDATKAVVDSAYVQSLQITYSFDSDIQNVTTNILPGSNEAVDLGSSTKRFRDLYLSGSSIVLGSLTLTDVNGEFTVTDSNGITAPIAISTTDITEGDNLFYTTARFDSDFGDKSTTNLTEGTQKYYTSARADSDARHSLTGGTGVTYVPGTGTISIGQDVGTSDSVSFQSIQVDNLTVTGTQTTVDTQTLNVKDPMIKMADSNIVDINDIGFFGQYGDGTTTRHTGLFRDASDKEYYLFSQLVDSPTTFVNRNGVDFELSTLNVGTINASNVLDSGHIERMIQSLSTDSAAVFLLVDSNYVQARQTHYLDSAAAITLINDTTTKTVPAGSSQEILRANMATNDQFRILVGGGNNAGYAEIATADDGTEPIYVRQYTGVFNSVARTLTLLDGSGNTTLPGSLTTSGNILPSADSTYDLGSSSNKWRELHLSGNTIYLGGEQLSASDGTLKINDKSVASLDSASTLADSAAKSLIPLGQAGQQLYYSSNNSRSFVKAQLVEINDKFVETASELTEEQNDAPTLENVFNTWNKFSHSGTSQPISSSLDANAWAYNSGTNTVSNPRNTGTPTGFYSNDKYEDYTHIAQFTSGQSDDDIGGVVIAYIIEDGKHYTLSAVRQTTGNVIANGLTWGLVYNIGQSGHTDTTRNTALLANGTSTAGVSGSGGWNAYPNGTKIYVRKQGSSLSIKCSQWNSTTIDDSTEITFDLTSDSRTNRFAGPVAYGYLAWSQGDMTFSNLEFTPDEAERLYYFQSDGSTSIYEYDAPNLQWNINTSLDLTDRSGRIFHNNKTGRTFYNDGTTTYPVGTVRQFNDVIYQLPLSSAPGEDEIGSLGLRAGMIAMADGVNWNPASKSTGRPYPVFWDGVNWLAMV